MRDRADHYAEADRLLEEVKDNKVIWAGGARERMLSAAIVHAVLACAPNEVYAKVEAAERPKKTEHLVKHL